MCVDLSLGFLFCSIDQYFCLCVLAVLGLPCCRGYSLVAMLASHRGGFSPGGAQAPGHRASEVVACGLSSCGSQGPEHRLNGGGAWA